MQTLNRIARTSVEAHRVNRARLAAGYHHPEIHDTDEQRALNAMIAELGEAWEDGEPIKHVVQYALSVRDVA